jgi:hypothetical protein
MNRIKQRFLKRIHFMVGVLLTLILAHLQPAFGVTDDEASTQAAALNVAGAFSNEGFKIRDGHWTNSISVGQPKLIMVNLYAGNQYWFVAAATHKAKEISIRLFDEFGKPVSVDPYQTGTTAAAGFSPTASGPYFVQIEEVEGEPATFCFLYTYK